MKNSIFGLLFVLSPLIALTNCGAGIGEPRVSYLSESTDNSVRGLYKAILFHEDTKFFQVADLTLRTSNPAGQLKIAANVKVYFGDRLSPEYFTYEFPDCPFNVLTGELNIISEQNDISIIGKLNAGVFEGEWFSKINGKVGRIAASKLTEPTAPADSVLVKPLSGHYRGKLVNKNPQSQLPERISATFISTQDNSGAGPQIKVTGNTRLYLGEFNSSEYFETEFSDVQFNFNTRYLTAKTKEYGLTYKGVLSEDGSFQGVVFNDGIGEVGPISLSRYP